MYSQTFLVTSVRGKGSLPTMAASAVSGFSGAMKPPVAFGFALDFFSAMDCSSDSLRIRGVRRGTHRCAYAKFQPSCAVTSSAPSSLSYPVSTRFCRLARREAHRRLGGGEAHGLHGSFLGPCRASSSPSRG